MALVYYYFDPAGKSEDSHRATLISTTLIEVMTSIFVFGAATKPLLDYLLGPHGTASHSALVISSLQAIILLSFKHYMATVQGLQAAFKALLPELILNGCYLSANNREAMLVPDTRKVRIALRYCADAVVEGAISTELMAGRRRSRTFHRSEDNRQDFC